MKDLVAKVGEYEKDGETKGRYVNIGVILQNDNGEYALLDASVSLAGVATQQRLLNPDKDSGKVIASIFEKRSGGGKQEKSAPRNKSEPFDDDIPF